MQSKQDQLTTVEHNHHVCLQLAGDRSIARTKLAKRSEPQNILLYARLSEDLDDILEALKECITYITVHTETKKGRVKYIYMERWALDALQNHMHGSANSPRAIKSFDDKRTLLMPSESVVLKEWLPEGENGET